jgi:hypothetical protein
MRLTTEDGAMTDDELGARIQDELRAVQAYFTHHEGGDSEEPLSDVVAALIRHCRVAAE